MIGLEVKVYILIGIINKVCDEVVMRCVWFGWDEWNE